MKKRILSLFLALVMAVGLLPASALAAGDNAVWPGSGNYNTDNNQVTSTQLPDSPSYTTEKWAYALNTTLDTSGAYYAGQVVLVGDSLYATGGGKLHKVDIKTGEGSAIAESAGSISGSYYDYLCYADGVILVATQTKLEAFDLTGKSLGSVTGAFSYYHPVQYHDGYVFCNGYIYKLETVEGEVSFVQVGTSAIGGAEFNWNTGVFAHDKFYTVGKDTVYAVDYKTGRVTDSLLFEDGRTANNKSTQGGVSYDSETGRLYWGTYSYNTKIHSVKVNADGTIDKTSYISADAGQKTICTPVIASGRVYLAGQSGNISVHSKDDLSQIYTVSVGGGKIQSTPILSTAGGTVRVYVQGYDGHLYMMVDNGGSGTVSKLAETKNYSDVKYPNAYEQIAMDASGNLYCYNESGYLFCFGQSDCAIPVITKNLDTAKVKYAKGSTASPLVVEASIPEQAGILSYQWQSSFDKENWSDIIEATDSSYTPTTSEEGTTYYRCVVTNTFEDKTERVVSSAAEIFVKILSTNGNVNILANTANKLDGGVAGKTTTIEGDRIAYVENFVGTFKYIALGAADDGSFEPIKENLTLYQGIASNKSNPTPGNISNSDLYTRRYTTSNFKLPYVASVEVTAEDGVTEETVYIVVDDGPLGCYTVGVTGFTADSTTYYGADTGITFSEANQTVTLTPVTSTIGRGEEDKSNWAWTSSNNSVAVVDATGTVKCIGGGEATITFSCDQIKKECKVISTAAKHVHSYTEGKCSVCDTKEPAAVSAYFTLVKDGKIVLSKDGSTELYKTAIRVSDADCDGVITINDAFITAHITHSGNGAADFVTEESNYGPFITKLWGVENSSVGYYLNHTSPSGLGAGLKKNDVLTAYFYQDTSAWSDVYTYISGQAKAAADNATTYTVSGVAGGKAVVPKGAAVKVYDSSKAEVASLATTVGEDGTFSLEFAEAGSYTIEVSGSASYTGSVWDATLNDGAGGYTDHEFTSSPVVPSRFAVEVMPYAEKTVYVSISMKSGEFAVNKNGDVMYYFPVTATDDPANPDGNVSIAEVLEAAHAQYHADGASAIAGHKDNFVTKLWGESNGGNASYYFNDLYMSGSGSKTGSNGREFKDALLATVTENNDHIYIYSFQATAWTKGDLYTYFYPVTETATAGVPKTITVKSAGGYGTNANKLETSLVKVTDANGVEQTALNTTVGADGTFDITFSKAGTYTVDVRTNGTNYVTPARCTVTVSPASGGDEEPETAFISVKDPQGKTYQEKTEYSISANETAYSLLLKTGLDVTASEETEYGVYVEAIEGLGEFDQGSESGWMYKVNGEFPDCSAGAYTLSAGDYVEWVYTRTLGNDIGGGKPSVRPEEEPIPPSADHPFSDTIGHWAEKAISVVHEKGLMTGTKEDTFSPETQLSRAMLVTILYRMAGEPAVTADNTFSDVTDGTWYTNAVIWASQNGIVNGVGQDLFAPNNDITREQMAAMLLRYSDYKGYDTTQKNDLADYTDADQISTWALAALQWANGEGLITGRKADLLVPQGDTTRAETATILMRYLETIA